jgi:hypothetical protein
VTASPEHTPEKVSVTTCRPGGLNDAAKLERLVLGRDAAAQAVLDEVAAEAERLAA